MVLSYNNTNWPGTFQLQSSDMGNLVIPELASDQLFTFHDNFSLDDTCIDSLFDPPPPLYDDQSVLFNPTGCLLPPLPEVFSGQQYLLLDSSSSNFEQQFCFPKRQKTTHNDYLGGIFDGTSTITTSNFLPTMNPSSGQILLPEFPFEMVMPPLLDYPLPNLPEVYGCGSSSDLVVHHQESIASTSNSTSTSCVNENSKPASATGTNLSPQSIAARVRRKKITEKTHELGKLIPGGHKMNTAEMFQAAAKYIKFMQAQLGILQSMPSIQENEGAFEGEELFRALLTSPIVQEKMYMAEKCLAPKKLIENSLANDHQLQSKPQLMKEISHLIIKTEE